MKYAIKIKPGVFGWIYSVTRDGEWVGGGGAHPTAASARAAAKHELAIVKAKEQPPAGPSALPASPTSTDNEGDDP